MLAGLVVGYFIGCRPLGVSANFSVRSAISPRG